MIPVMEPHVLILAGGLSYEREVSLRSGRRVLDALRAVGVEATVRDADTTLLPSFATERPDAVVRPEELSTALTDWALQLLEGAEVMMPGTALKVLKDATREHRYVLQAAGFYGRLPWRVTW